MTVKQVLFDWLVEGGLADPADPLEKWLDDHWFRFPFQGRPVRIFPLVLGFKDSITLHDLHHILGGYGMTWRGEIELAAWELGSGGCAWRPYAWVDRVFRTLGGLLLMPAGTVHAFVRGAGADRNLYGLRASEVLPMEFGQLRRLVNALIPSSIQRATSAVTSSAASAGGRSAKASQTTTNGAPAVSLRSASVR